MVFVRGCLVPKEIVSPGKDKSNLFLDSLVLEEVDFSRAWILSVNEFFRSLIFFPTVGRSEESTFPNLLNKLANLPFLDR